MKRIAKGLVMDIKGKHAVIMTSDGKFLNVKKPSSVTSIGDEITSQVIDAGTNNLIRYALVAAAIMLLLVPFIYMKQAYATVAYINVDINPSLEMGINKFNKVNEVIPLNDDAKKLLSEVSIKGLNIKDAINKVISGANSMGFISNEKANNIEIAIVKLKDKQVNISENELVDDAKDTVSHMDIDATIKVQKTDKKSHDAAKKEKISTNKYLDKNPSSSSNSVNAEVKKAEKNNDNGKTENPGKGNQSSNQTSKSSGAPENSSGDIKNNNTGKGNSDNSNNSKK